MNKYGIKRRNLLFINVIRRIDQLIQLCTVAAASWKSTKETKQRRRFKGKITQWENL